ncbi:MAG: stage V sporulation protein AC [Oscillospiraceae bacterium]|nr:stage V sporulation protein AC [Oscillospiraceae bacterium]
MISKKEYAQMSKKASPPTKSWKTIPCAFIIGGLICTLGQVIKNIFIYYGVDEETAGTWCSICLVVLSALFTGLGLYEKLAKHAGAGTLVPITGFANSISSSALEAKSEGFILGVGAKIFTIAGPVILYGTAASVVYGIIYYIVRQF